MQVTYSFISLSSFLVSGFISLTPPSKKKLSKPTAMRVISDSNPQSIEFVTFSPYLYITLYSVSLFPYRVSPHLLPAYKHTDIMYRNMKHCVTSMSCPGGARKRNCVCVCSSFHLCPLYACMSSPSSIIYLYRNTNYSNSLCNLLTPFNVVVLRMIMFTILYTIHNLQYVCFFFGLLSCSLSCCLFDNFRFLSAPNKPNSSANVFANEKYLTKNPNLPTNPI